MSDTRYISPIFYRGEQPFHCTINVYLSYTDDKSLVKSRYSSHGHAVLEAPKMWGTLLYRINVKMKSQTKSEISRAYAEKHGIPVIELKLPKWDEDNGNQG